MIHIMPSFCIVFYLPTLGTAVWAALEEPELPPHKMITPSERISENGSYKKGTPLSPLFFPETGDKTLIEMMPRLDPRKVTFSSSRRS